MKKYIYKGKSVPGMYEGDLPKGQFGNLEDVKKTVSDWTNKNKKKISNAGSVFAETAGKIFDPFNLNKNPSTKTIIKQGGKNIANRINKWFGGDDDYWRKGGGLK